MRLSLAFSALVFAVPAFANAIPPRIATTNPSLIDTRIPLTKRNIRLTDEQGVVDPEVLKSQVAKALRKMSRAFQAYEKNTGSPHPNALKESLELLGRDTGALPLTDEQDALWQGSISVGTPPSDFTVDFDTGSGDLFLPGANCGTSCDGHKIYDTSASSTAKDQHQHFGLGFGDGSTVECDVFTDTVTIAGLTATNQAVGSATQYSAGFGIDQSPPDGLMGMSFAEIAVFGRNPYFQTLIAQGGTDAAQFSFKLAENGSELFLGGVNTNLFTGEFTNVDVTQKAFWQVAIDSVNVRRRSAISNLQAIIDTGTTLIIAPQEDARQFYQAVPGAKDATDLIGEGFFTFPCGSNPKVSLTFGGKPFAISKDTFNLGQVSEGSPHCVGAITGAKGFDSWIVGDVFMRNVYTKFDVEAQQVGFADLAYYY